MDVRARPCGCVHVDLQVVRITADAQDPHRIGLPIVQLVPARIGVQHFHIVHVHAHVEVPVLQPVVDDGSVGGRRVAFIVMQQHLVQCEHVRLDVNLVREAVEGVQVVDAEAGILQRGRAIDLRVIELSGDIDHTGDLSLYLTDRLRQIGIDEAQVEPVHAQFQVEFLVLAGIDLPRKIKGPQGVPLQ